MISIIHKLLWAVATSLIFIASIYMTGYLGFPQFKFKNMWKSLKTKEKGKISNFSVLMMTLAGKIGVGSIAGVALAIYIGGPGSIFWLWFMTILSAVLCYSETILGNIYKEKDGEYYKGGPSYYINKGLGYSKLGALYAIIILFSYVGGFISVQTNTITASIKQISNISPIIIGLALVILCFLMIVKGVKEIANITSKIVPFMVIFYLLAGLFIMTKNIDQIPNIFLLILKDAFEFKPIITGFLISFIVGIQREIFATEAGLGTSSIASSVSSTDDATSLAYMQMLGVYLTSFIICTITAFVILSSNYLDINYANINGIELTQNSFLYHIPRFGHYIVIITIFFFALSTILTGYYYGESSYKYLDKKANNKRIFVLKMFTLLMIFLGSILSPSLIWEIVDILVAILAIINIYAILKLKKDIYDVTIEEKFKK